MLKYDPTCSTLGLATYCAYCNISPAEEARERTSFFWLSDNLAMHYHALPCTAMRCYLRGDEGFVQEGTNRSVEAAHTILLRPLRARAVVDAVLHSNGGVHNRQQSCRHPDEGHAATVKSSSQTYDVQDNAAANCEDWLAATKAEDT